MACQVELTLFQINREDLAAAIMAKRLDSKNADHPRTNHCRSASGLDPCNFRGMHRNRHGFYERCLGERKTGWQLVNNVSRNCNIFGKGAVPTVVTARNSEDLTVVTEVHVPSRAEAARTTAYGGVERDPVAHAKGCNVRTDFDNNTRGFVAHNYGRDPPTGAAVVSVNVASAYSAGLHLNKHGVLSQVRLRHLLETKVSNIF